MSTIFGQAHTALLGFTGRRRLAATSILFPNYVCNSIGGVASTSVFDFLTANLPKVSENRFRRGVSQWKHTPYPPISPSIRKAIFLYGDPMSATTSIFRRNLCQVHLANKGLPSFPMTFEDYLDLSRDVFRTSEHIANWTAGIDQYPILCIKSDVVFEQADVICDFFEIRANREKFPQRLERTTTTVLHEQLGETKYQKLEEVLRDANTLFRQLPDVFIATARSDGTTSL